ncbi:hypothetical protein [Candidatus Hodarchaeum mangrovi]
MRFVQHCPNCGASDIRGAFKFSPGMYTFSVPIAFPKTATLEIYICAECGYTQFFTDEKGLMNVREYSSSPHEKEKPPPSRWVSCGICGANFKGNFCPKCGEPFDRS